MTFRPPCLCLEAPEPTDTGMEKVFEAAAGCRVGKNTAGKFVAAQPAVRPDDLGAEHLEDLRQGGLAWLNNLARQVVGVHHRESARLEEAGGSGLTHANASG